MLSQCTCCQSKFTITDLEKIFFEKISPSFVDKKYLISTPKLCPDCRQQIRLAFRNERKVYNRNCDFCKTSFISVYSPDKHFPVYCNKCWWSDAWDPMSYGRDFDFSCSFFDQWKELWYSVPKLGVINWGNNVNSDYTNDTLSNVNCYLTFDGDQGQDCYFGETFSKVKDCVDFLFLKECELCYEVMNCSNCYNLQYSRFCENCSDSYFLLDCIGCKHCFGCTNLVQKEYYIFNKPYSKEEYEQTIASFELGNHIKREVMKKRAEEFFVTQFKRAYRGHMNENANGNNLNNCQNVTDSFDCNNVRDSQYCTNLIAGATDCVDVDGWGDNTALAYNSAMVSLGAQHVIGSYYVAFDSHDVYHSAFCWQGCSNLFGCADLRHKEYCILNKQYSKEEYLELVPKIIEHMQSTGEWGQFFPSSLSAFGYNETVANEYMPLAKEAILQKGFQWSDYEAPKPKVENVLQAHELPEDIRDVTDDIVNVAIVCEITGRLFRIVKPELSFYRQHSIPLPHRHPDQRHTDRMNLRPPRKLWQRNCQKCNREIVTPYSSDQPDVVYCEECYSKAL